MVLIRTNSHSRAAAGHLAKRANFSTKVGFNVTANFRFDALRRWAGIRLRMLPRQWRSGRGKRPDVRRRLHVDVSRADWEHAAPRLRAQRYSGHERALPERPAG